MELSPGIALGDSAVWRSCKPHSKIPAGCFVPSPDKSRRSSHTTNTRTTPSPVSEMEAIKISDSTDNTKVTS